MSFSAEDIRIRLKEVLSNKHQTKKSALRTFEHFDKDNNGYLDFNEFRKCIDRLLSSMQLPNINDEALYKLMQSFDFDENGLTLTPNEFVMLYYNLLMSIRDRYFPERKYCFDRAKVIGHQALEMGMSIYDHLKFTKRLGAGSYGEVFLVVDRSSQHERVCKVVNKGRSDLPYERISGEIAILKQLDHPNTVKIHEVFEDPEYVYIIMELCRGGELIKHIMERRSKGHAITECHIANIMSQVLQSIAYCQGQHIVHKDLKPENVMYHTEEDDSLIKVIDFGVAEMFGKEVSFSSKAAGTALYMAPEVFDFRVCLKSDVWSAGVIMYLLLSGKLPFTGRSLSELKLRIKRLQPAYQLHFQQTTVSKDALNLLKKMLVKSPYHRISASDALDHPWFSNSTGQASILTDEVEQHLQQHMKYSDLKNVVYNVMAHQLQLNGKQVRGVVQLFHSFDSDKDGVLTREEVATILQQKGWRAHEISRLLSVMDSTGDDQIFYNEFLAACYRWQEADARMMWSAFEKMDTDGDGKISPAELQQLGKLTGREVPTEEIAKLVQEIDEDGDGHICWDDFKRWILS